MNEERKTLEQRAQMTDLERLRHSASHVLATAILKIWPEAQFAAGPPVENGFYYDVDLPHRISPDDFERIEAEMKKEIKANHLFEKIEVSRDEALKLGKQGRLAALGERAEPSKFKLDIIENIPANERISLYRNGDFIDLCAGPHAAGRASTEQAERQNVARQMTPLFPELIACLRELQAIQPAAECEFFAGSTFQLLGDFLQAVKHYRVAANDYGELNLNEQRREAHQRCEKLLALYTDHLLREGRLHDAIPHFLQLAEASGEIGNRAGFVHAALHAARALLQTTPNLEQARGMAQLAYENSDADSESARSALDIISQCEQRSVNLGKDKTSG